MDRPFEGIGWLPQMRNLWTVPNSSDNRGPESSSNGNRGRNPESSPDRGYERSQEKSEGGEVGREVGRIDAGSYSGGPVRTARREQRSDAALTFAVCGLASNGRFFVELSSTLNVSHSGCCLWLRTCPQADSALALREVPGGAALPRGASQVLFQVAWLRPEAGGWLVGAFALGQADLLSGNQRVSGYNRASGSGDLAFPSRRP